MLFNSFGFAVFFLVVYSLYLGFRKNRLAQNILLLLASYFFYAAWDWRFLSLLFLSTIIDFFVGKGMFAASGSRKKKFLLGISVFSNLSILGFFKYFNFFTESFIPVLESLGFSPSVPTMRIILPVGISFYTFQTLSYTIDIYRGHLKPSKSIIDFALFVSFFPQLVAGPIERAKNLLPQIERPRNLGLDQINAGLFLVLWGYFKKVVIADNVALIANEIFNHYLDYQGGELLVGVLAFTVQIYCDFSGYSDIARGISKLMGFELMVNFKLPYFAINPSDFWNRWHISLSSWLRDYLYIGLGGNRGSKLNVYRNLTLTMLLGGLWHGAAWNFVFWGLFHGAILVLYRLLDKNPGHASPWSGDGPKIVVLGKMGFMFALTLVGWVIFRADSATQIVYFLTKLSLTLEPEGVQTAMRLSLLSLPLFLVQLAQYVSRDLLILVKLPSPIRIFVFSLLLLGIAAFAAQEPSEFIYFQF